MAELTPAQHADRAAYLLAGATVSSYTDGSEPFIAGDSSETLLAAIGHALLGQRSETRDEVQQARLLAERALVRALRQRDEARRERDEARREAIALGDVLFQLTHRFDADGSGSCRSCGRQSADVVWHRTPRAVRAALADGGGGDDGG